MRGLTLLLLLAAGSAPAQSEGAWRSFLDEALLSRSDLIVVARHEAVVAIPGSPLELVRFKVGRTLKGAPRKEVLVGGLLDRARSFPQLSKVLFLRTMPSGEICQVVDLIDLTPPEAAVVPDTVAAHLAAAKAGGPVGQRAAILERASRDLDAGSVFGVRVAALEIERMVGHPTPGLDQSLLARMIAVSDRVPRPAFRDLQRAIEKLGRALGQPFEGSELAFRPGRERQLFIEARARFLGQERAPIRVRFLGEMVGTFGPRLGRFLIGLLDDRDVAVRLEATRWLGDFATSQAAVLLAKDWESLAVEERKVRIEALGKIGDLRSHDLLRRELEGELFEAEAALALARLGSERERDLLRRHAKGLQEAGVSADRVAAIERLETEAWRAEERARREALRERFGLR